ncbi:MAG: cytochrome c [Acidobacteria bacterium]|nr:cytochrome c [Acidobacteriota bacterium]MBI3489173.1 cytochrome c [Acidobacteriota bacterium]
MRPFLPPTLFLAAAALMAGDPVKDLPKFQGGDLNRYWADACARCHGVTGNGRDNNGRQLPDAGFDFTDSRKANRKKDSDWVKVMQEGKDKMPAFKDKMAAEEVQRMIPILRKFAAK